MFLYLSGRPIWGESDLWGGTPFFLFFCTLRIFRYFYTENFLSNPLCFYKGTINIWWSKYISRPQNFVRLCASYIADVSINKIHSSYINVIHHTYTMKVDKMNWMLFPNRINENRISKTMQAYTVCGPVSLCLTQTWCSRGKTRVFREKSSITVISRDCPPPLKILK
jgi:hypothetical protein